MTCPIFNVLQKLNVGITYNDTHSTYTAQWAISQIHTFFIVSLTPLFQML